MGVLFFFIRSQLLGYAGFGFQVGPLDVSSGPSHMFRDDNSGPGLQGRSIFIEGWL